MKDIIKKIDDKFRNTYEIFAIMLMCTLMLNIMSNDAYDSVFDVPNRKSKKIYDDILFESDEYQKTCNLDKNLLKDIFCIHLHDLIISPSVQSFFP